MSNYMKKIAIASDHGGYDLKNQLIKFQIFVTNI